MVQRLLGGGDYEYAKNVCVQILGESPNVDRARFFLGVSLSQMKLYEEARPVLEAAAASSQDFPERKHAHHFLGWAHYHLGDLAKAKVSFESHLGFVPEEPDTIFGLGLIAFDEDKLDDAETLFQRSVDLLLAQRANGRPSRRDIGKGYARLGDVSMRRDDPAKAEDRYMKSLEQFPDFVEVWAKLARARDRLGKTKEAESARREEIAAKERVEARAKARESRQPQNTRHPSDPPAAQPAPGAGSPGQPPKQP
jgi:tetratricopeptide (TPR) repeat protein